MIANDEEPTNFVLFSTDECIVRDTNCVVGDKPKAKEKIVRNCPCTKADFEWYALLLFFVVFQVAYSSMSSEFNHVKNSNDECVLVADTTPLPDDDTRTDGARDCYERTLYRIIPYSTCEGGYRPDHGTSHR